MKSSNRASRCLLALVLLSSSLPRIALAEPTASDKASARDLFKEGKALREKGDHQGAVAKFEAAYALVPSPITAFELAREKVSVMQLLEARELLLDIGRMPPKIGESPEAAKARSDAAALASDLKVRIPTLTVKVVSKTAATVTIDGDPVPTAALGTPRRTNPGKHVIVARAEGVPDRTVEVTLAEKETREVEVRVDGPPVVDTAVAPPPVPEPPKAAPITTPPLDDAGRGTSQRIIGIAVGAIGLVGLGVGAAIGFGAKSKWDLSADKCPNDLCNQEGADLAEDARSAGRTSRLVLGLGAVALVGGVVLYVTAPSSKSATTVSLSPTGFTLRGSF